MLTKRRRFLFKCRRYCLGTCSYGNIFRWGGVEKTIYVSLTGGLCLFAQRVVCKVQVLQKHGNKRSILKRFHAFPWFVRKKCAHVVHLPLNKERNIDVNTVQVITTSIHPCKEFLLIPALTGYKLSGFIFRLEHLELQKLVQFLPVIYIG